MRLESRAARLAASMFLPAALLAAALSVWAAGPARAEGDPPPGLAEQVKSLQEANVDLQHRLDELAKAIDDVSWFQRMGDVAVVDKWRICGPPPAHPKNPKAPGAVNPIKFFTYTFVPKDRKPGEKLPLIILPHGGVHADFDSPYHVHILHELIAQGYVIVAPDYRGSTGYGRGFYEQIDYGGLESEDIHATREWALANFDFLDPGRVGLLGWSHGGLIVLMEAFAHPKDYACVFAGNPVSDLVARLGYEDEEYRADFSAPYHIGKTVRQDIEEYKRRSPVWHAEQLEIPLRIHTNTNDEDVNYLEVEHLIQALKAAGKEFEYKVYQNAPGGHSMDRMDTIFAKDARRDIWKFLARYLKPRKPAA
ncbi:MAG TPA: alpha/beta fold hydrolase [Candidatus Saccharimonadales bacterium]|nr:alpha/beta fold hydrolase [Candidatus Saccharimonadales bacterium]